MKPRRSLPLHVLPAFDAAARHGSFRAAADELHLTPSAISHQIRTLEEALGVELFHRLPRGLVLSEAGRVYAGTVREALDKLDQGAERFGSSARRRVCVSMPDFVARLFALPQVARFRARHPALELQIETSLELCPLGAGKVDAAVRMGYGSWPELSSHWMNPLVATFVASPELGARARELSDAASLPVVCLKNQESFTRAALARGGFTTAPSAMLHVDNCMALIQAAKEGLGVAVIYLPPAHGFESTERLVRLGSCPVEEPFGMYFVHPSGDADRLEVRALRDWIVDASFCASRPRFGNGHSQGDGARAALK